MSPDSCPACSLDTLEGQPTWVVDASGVQGGAEVGDVGVHCGGVGGVGGGEIVDELVTGYVVGESVPDTAADAVEPEVSEVCGA